MAVSIYESLEFGWANCCDGDADTFEKYSDEAIEAYVKAYAESYGVEWDLDSWGNYRFYKEKDEQMIDIEIQRSKLPF